MRWSRAACVPNVARRIGLGAHMLLGKQARDAGGANSDNILGDVMEALVGAAFLTLRFRAYPRDHPQAVGRGGRRARSATLSTPNRRLQEWAAGQRHKLPEYRLVACARAPTMRRALPWW